MKNTCVLAGRNLLLGMLCLVGCKSVHHEVFIHTNPKTVWKVLLEIEEYPDWNPMVRLIEGEIKEGNKVKYLLKLEENHTIQVNATVVKLIPEKLLNQTGGNPWVFSFNQLYQIEEMGDSVKVTVHEDYRGIGVTFWNTQPINDAYGSLNAALKERCEKMSQILEIP